MMKIFNLEDKGLIIDDVPLCPICDQPIEHPDLAAIGGIEDGGFQSFCLIHSDCAGQL
jgi:hypothetical protein